MLRLEIEIALLEGKVAVKDLPALWNAKMEEYLGVTPPNDAVGVLQDIHWSGGMIGYFPTYALGNLVSAQLWEKINQDIPDLTDQIRAGKFEALLGLAAREDPSPRGQVRTAGTGAEGHRVQDRSGGLYPLPDEEVRRDLRSVIPTCFAVSSGPPSCSPF